MKALKKKNICIRWEFSKGISLRQKTEVCGTNESTCLCKEIYIFGDILGIQHGEENGEGKKEGRKRISNKVGGEQKQIGTV